MSDELITEARWRAAELAVKPNTGYGWATEEELMSMLANDLEATEARVKELEAGVAGQIVTASLENGKTRVECGLEDCECPEHDWPVPPAGTYITVRLDEDCQIGLFRVRVHTLPVESEGE